MIVFARSAIEVRCPFFDYDLVSFLYGLPERLRLSLDLQYLVLTRRMPDLARIPYEKDNLPAHSSRALRLGHRITGRARRAVNRVVPLFPERPRLYADYENYLRGELADWGWELLMAPRTLDRGLFNPDAVRGLWERHQRGDELWTIGKIAPLMTLELVLRRLYDADGDSATKSEYGGRVAAQAE
jgi:asparagine synthase (glutamine-hydrolysing)